MATGTIFKTKRNIWVSSIVPCRERGRQRGCECQWRRRRRVRRRRWSPARVVALLRRRNRLRRVGLRRQLVFPRLLQLELGRLGRAPAERQRDQRHPLAADGHGDGRRGRRRRRRWWRLSGRRGDASGIAPHEQGGCRVVHPLLMLCECDWVEVRVCFEFFFYVVT